MVWLCETKVQRKSTIMLHKDSFIIYIKIEDIYVDIAKHVRKRFKSKTKNKPKTYSYLKNDSGKNEKNKRHKKVS